MRHSQTSSIPAPGPNASAAESLRTPGAPLRLPELLAPAGDWECARAAVENGADAIYFGLERFNARMRANNFTAADLPKLMAFLHRRGVKGYVTFNILVFENELAEAEQYVRTIIAAGADAAIVQDVGVCRLIRRLSPDFPIHVSTQMTITSAAGVEFARELGCDLVVLARECSLKEIASIQASQLDPHQPSANHAPLPLEVFIHGALCVAYSGQCLTSEALGGRSANRGECAQACRMPYDLIADGKLVPLGDRKYLLSPQDLAGLEVLPELVRAGVASLKIEGRLKSPEYVASITRVYRKALDQLGDAQRGAEVETPCTLPASGEQEQSASAPPSPPLEERGGERRPMALPGVRGDNSAGCCSEKSGGLSENNDLLSLPLSSKGGEGTGAVAGGHRAAGTEHEIPPHSATAPNHPSPVTDWDRYDLEMAFSRGLYTGWFRGTNNQALVHGRFGKKRGVFLGEVARIEGERVQVSLRAPLKPGDGVVFDAGHPEADEQGGRVYEVRNPKPETRMAELHFGRGDIDFKCVHVGDKLWKTSDPELDRRLRQSFEGETPRFQRAITLEVHGLAGQPLTLLARDDAGHEVRADSTMPLARAENQPLTTARLREQLGRLGGTPFKLGELKNLLEGAVLLPVSELNQLRRKAVHELEALRSQPRRWTMECEQPASGSPSPPLEERGRERRPTSVPAVRDDIPAVCRPNSSDGPAENDGLLSLPLSSKGGEGSGAAVSEAVGQAAPPAIPHSALRTPHLIVLTRTPAQLEAALDCGLETVYCEFEDPRKYREAVALARGRRSETGGAVEIFVAPPRIFKLGEEWTLRQVRSSEADGYLVRNYDHLACFAHDRRIGDYSLNIANRLAADYFTRQFGLERVTASYDLNFAQLEALLQAAPPHWFEVTIHQHMPMFHMEHCVFCAFLSSGTDYTNCGRPCDRHDLKLRDRVGAEHPVKADVGCRNTVFNARAQTGAEYVARMLALGVRHFRLEFLNETPDQTARTIAQYRQLLRGEITGPQLWRELKLVNQLGVTRGQISGRARA